MYVYIQQLDIDICILFLHGWRAEYISSVCTSWERNNINYVQNIRKWNNNKGNKINTSIHL